VPCDGGRIEWRFLDSTGGMLRNWSTDSSLSVTPARCPSIEIYTVEVRCSLEPEPECVDSVVVEVECTAQPEVTVEASPAEICRGERVDLQASAGFISYEWEHGKSGRIISEMPGSTTTYRVVAEDSFGCVATGEVTVNVIPDPLPGPIGNVLHVARDAWDVVFSYAEIPGTWGDYELVAHEPIGGFPCTDRTPPTPPDPVTMEGAAVADAAPPGSAQPALRHTNGAATCPQLLFYKVRATSACSGNPGSACDGFAMQEIPCP
jgi:hypothetical protein